MKQSNFDALVELRIGIIRESLKSKAEEPASDKDRLHNFVAAARFHSKPQTPEQALWGMFVKHLVSLADIVEATARGEVPPMHILEEKIKNCINYPILLNGLLLDRMTKPPCKCKTEKKLQTEITHVVQKPIAETPVSGNEQLKKLSEDSTRSNLLNAFWSLTENFPNMEN